MSKEAMRLALEAAYLAGFNASGEGYNGEYPFGGKNQNPEADAVWVKDRDNTIREALAEQPAQKRPQNCGTGYCSCIECVMEPAQQEPVVWMYVNKSTHETKFQKHMRDFVDHSLWSEVPLYGEPLANHELQCVCGAVWLGDELVHLPDKRPPAQRKPLTDEEIKGIYEDCDAPTGGQFTLAFTRAIEAAHGIKGDI